MDKINKYLGEAKGMAGFAARELMDINKKLKEYIGFGSDKEFDKHIKAAAKELRIAVKLL